MAELILVSWRDIPAQVIVKAGRATAKRPLAERFQQAIDRAAMRAGLRDTDAYLGEWRRVRRACGDDLEAEADAAAARLDAEYPPERVPALVATGRDLTKGSADDRHDRQLRQPRGRDRLRAAVRDHRRAHQPDRPQEARGPDGARRLCEVEADTLAQVAAGAHMLDVNAGIPLADEPRILADTIHWCSR